MNDAGRSGAHAPAETKGKLPYTPPTIRDLTPEEVKRVAPLIEAEMQKRAAKNQG